MADEWWSAAPLKERGDDDDQWWTAAPVKEPERSAAGRLGAAYGQGEARAVVGTKAFTRDLEATVEDSAFGRVFSDARDWIRGAMGLSPGPTPDEIRERAPDVVEQAAQERLDRYEAEGFTPKSLRDVEGLGSGIQFALEGVASSLPAMGVAASNAPVAWAMLAGEANEELKERVPDLSEDQRVALSSGVGVAMFALDRIGLGYVFKGLKPGRVAASVAAGELTELLTKRGLSGAAARTFQAALAEGTTEALQEGLVVGATAAAGGEYSPAEVTERLANAFALGGAAGGVISGATQPFYRGEDRPEPEAEAEAPLTPTPPAPPARTGLMAGRPEDVNAYWQGSPDAARFRDAFPPAAAPAPPPAPPRSPLAPGQFATAETGDLGAGMRPTDGPPIPGGAAPTAAGRAADAAAEAAPERAPQFAPLIEEARWLLGSGYDSRDVVAMSPSERQEAVAEARDGGVEPLAPEDARVALEPVYDFSRASDPNLTDADRASPIPNDLLSEGRAAVSFSQRETVSAPVEAGPPRPARRETPVPRALPAPSINIPAREGQVAPTPLRPDERAPDAARLDPRRAREPNLFVDEAPGGGDNVFARRGIMPRETESVARARGEVGARFDDEARAAAVPGEPGGPSLRDLRRRREEPRALPAPEAGTPGPASEGATDPAAADRDDGSDRETRPDGRWTPREGDKVYQRVAGFGGTPASIRGEVYRKGGELRVRITGSESMIGGGYDGPKTRRLSEGWTVEGDPEPQRREDAKRAEQDRRDQEWRDEMDRVRRETEQGVERAVSEGRERLTPENARPGLRVTSYNPDQPGEFVIDQIGDDGVAYFTKVGEEDEGPRSAPMERFTVAPADGEVAAEPETSSGERGGPRVAINTLGRDGLSDTERGGPEVDMAEGYTLSDAPPRRMTEAEARADASAPEGRPYKAVVRRDEVAGSPATEAGYGDTPRAAIEDAYRKAQKGATPPRRTEGDRRADAMIRENNKMMPTGYRVERGGEGGLVLLGPDGPISFDRSDSLSEPALRHARARARSDAARRAEGSSAAQGGQRPAAPEVETAERARQARAEGVKSGAAKDWWKGLDLDDRAARLEAAGYSGSKTNPAWPFIKMAERERILQRADEEVLSGASQGIREAFEDAQAQGPATEAEGTQDDAQADGDAGEAAGSDAVAPDAPSPVGGESNAEWWGRISRENGGQPARDALEKAGVPLSNVGRPWAYLPASQRAAVRSAASEAGTGATPSSIRPAAPSAPPVDDARLNERLAQARTAGENAALAGDPRTPPRWAPEGSDLADAWRAGYADKSAGSAQPPAEPSSAAADRPAADPEAPTRADDASGLTREEQDRLAELRSQFRRKIKGQLNAGLDPELVSIATEMAGLYVKAGARRFRDLLRAMMEDIGLTFEQAQPYARIGYNQVRGDMDLAGEDVSGMDGDQAVLAEIRAMREEPRGDQVGASDGNAGSEPEQVQTPAADGGAGPRGVGDRDESEPAGGGGAPGRHASAPAGGGGRAGASGGGRGGRLTPPDADATPANYVVPPGGLEPSGGEKTRARQSLEAIRTLKSIEAEGRPTATPEEQALLARYGGAGAFKSALPRSDGSVQSGWQGVADDLRETVTDEEYDLIARTSQYAYYTSEPVLRGMWSAVRRLGFEGGRVFEPGMGVGGFLGTVPQAIAGDVRYTGRELDPITARIAKLLYPKANVSRSDFTREPLARDHYDLVIGNPPFADIPIQSDPDYPQGFFLHDYFFAKSLDAVRPGGILAFISSAGTLNKRDAQARRYMQERADFIGAIRLPGTAFKDFAGTEVTTDVIFLRKRLPGEEAGPSLWTSTTEATLPGPDGEPVRGWVNAWTAANPVSVLGEEGFFDKLYKGRYAVRGPADQDLRASFGAAVRTILPENVVTERNAAVVAEEVDADLSERKAGSFYMKDNELWQSNGRGEGRKVGLRGKGVPGGLSKADMARVRDLVGVRDALRNVLKADVGDRDATAERKALNKAYDAFVAKHGPINKAEFSYRRPSAPEAERARDEAREEYRLRGEPFDEGSFDPTEMIASGTKPEEVARARKAARETQGAAYREGSFDPAEVPDKIIEKRVNVVAFMDDPESYRLRAIERYDDKTGKAAKGLVFTESVVTREPEANVSSVQDALLHDLNVSGSVDLDRIAELAETSRDAARESLGDLIFQNPETRRWQTREQYLSGNVRQKLEIAREAQRQDDEYTRNVAALERVQPTPIPPQQIHPSLGAPWISAEDYAAFAADLGVAASFRYTDAVAQWSVDGDTESAVARNEWGTTDRPFPKLMQAVMNGQQIRITRTEKVGDTTRTWVDQAATQAAQDKATKLREKFADWLWSEDERARRLADVYNRTFNAVVAPSFDGGYLTTPGVSAEWAWRPHQRAVIARILQSGNTYMAHAVGAGKTSAMIGAGMEAKRLGFARKPMYAVPNHMLAQFTKEFYEQYPLARIAVADERNFHTSRRKQFIAEVGSNDYDAVIITHSAFGKIPISDEFADTLLKAEIAKFEDALDEIGDDRENRITRKKIENAKERLEQRLSGRRKKGQDQVFTFEEMGVDMLFVDEAHLFRKLDFATTMGTIKGIDPQGSQASWDLYVKTRFLERKNPGRGLVFASGTPVTNTMAELYTISRYMQEDALGEAGVARFDAWARSFGEVASALEQAPDGSYKSVSRFAKFVNTAELSLMVRRVMDVVTSRDLAQYVTRPALAGGQRNVVVVEPSAELKAYQRTLAERMSMIEARKGPPEPGDDIMLSVINDGRLAAIDPRFVGLPGGGSTKLEKLIDRAYETWERTKDHPFHTPEPDGYSDEPAFRGPATQMIFTTLGLNPTERSAGFSTVGHIRRSLERQGVPSDEIAFLGDAKNHVQRQRLFNDMNEGKVRILIGGKSMFTGVNAQRRLAAIHNLDPLWFPADDEQRNGRGIRQGNLNREIEINDYSAKGTYDATMWQMMARKAGFIEAFFAGDPSLRSMDDLGEASQYEQAKALSTADPRILKLTEWKQERDTLRRRRAAAQSERWNLESRIDSYQRSADFRQNAADRLRPVIEALPDVSGKNYAATINGVVYKDRAEAGAALGTVMDEIHQANRAMPEAGRRVGEIAGLPIVAKSHAFTLNGNRVLEFSLAIKATNEDEFSLSDSYADDGKRGEALARIVRRIPDVVRERDVEAEKYRGYVARDKETLDNLEDFGQQAALAELEGRIDALEAELLSSAQATEAAEAPPDRDADEMRLDDDGNPIVRDRRDPAAPAGPDATLADLEARMSELGLSGVRLSVSSRARMGGARGRFEAGPNGRAIVMASMDMATLDHEAIHALRYGGMFTDPEWAALSSRAKALWIAKHKVRERYPEGDEALWIEEAVAEEFAAWADGRRRGAPNVVAGAFGKVRETLEAIGNWIRGRGFTSAEAVFRAADRGDVGAREGRAAAEPVSRESVDTSSAAFRRWFGDSKVVDESGEPLVVYHGTNADFEAFDPAFLQSAFGRFEDSNIGFMFTNDSKAAGVFAQGRRPKRGRSGPIMPVYLSIKRPLVVDFANARSVRVNGRPKFTDNILFEKASEALGVAFRPNEKGAGERMASEMVRQGYDGLHVVNSSLGEATPAVTRNAGGPSEAWDVWVAFRPEQIKSVFNRGTFDPDSPRILERRAPRPANQAEQDVAGFMSIPTVGTGPLPGIRRGVDRIRKAKPAGMKRAMLFVDQQVSNQASPLRSLEVGSYGRLLPGMESAFKSFEIAVNDTGRNETLLYYGAASFDDSGAFMPKRGTKGIVPMLRQLGDGDAVLDWMHWMAARRAQALEDRGVPTPMTEGEIQKGLAKETDLFRRVAADWKAFNDANLEFAVEAGLVSRAAADAMQADDTYIPFYRANPDDHDDVDPSIIGPVYSPARGVNNPKSGIHAIKGGRRLALNNLVENMIVNSKVMVSGAMRNVAAQRAAELMEITGETEIWSASDVRSPKGGPEDGVIRFRRDGKLMKMKPKDPMLTLAMAGLRPEQHIGVIRFAQQVSSFVRQGITLALDFMIRNAIRGTTATAVLTGGGNIGLRNNTLTGFSKALRNTKEAQAFKARSGMGDFRFGGSDIGFGKDDVLINLGVGDKTVGYRFRQFLTAMEHVGTATEIADRVALQENLIRSGVRPDEAAYQALNIINYGRRGSSRSLGVLLSVVPFLNARIQGLTRLMETSSGERDLRRGIVQTSVRGAILAAASAALWAWNNDDEERREEYEAEPLWRRLNYHIVYAGDKKFMIPKAFEIGVLYGTIPELMLEATVQGDTKELPSALTQTLVNTFSFNPVPAAVLPLMEVAANYDTFTERPIEGRRLQSRLREDRVDTRTSGAAIALGDTWLADALNLSPVEMQHLMDGYAGAYASWLLGATDMLAAEFGMLPKRPEGALGSYPGSAVVEAAIGSLVKPRDADAANRYLGEFYDVKRHVSRIVLSARDARQNGEVERARDLLTRYRAAPAAYRLTNRASSQLSDLNAAIRSIRMNRDLGREEMRRRLIPLIERRNAISSRVVSILEELEERQGAQFRSAE